MTLRYGYICPTHGPFLREMRFDWVVCHVILSEGYGFQNYCGEKSKRDWRFHADYSFEPYFAPSFGTVVKSRTHAKDLAKIASEEATLRTGIPHDYSVIDTHDDAAAGVDTAQKLDALDNTRRHAVNGAAWSQERVKEIEASKAQVTAERKKKVDA
jgi:hypothetical protein